MTERSDHTVLLLLSQALTPSLGRAETEWRDAFGAIAHMPREEIIFRVALTIAICIGFAAAIYLLNLGRRAIGRRLQGRTAAFGGRQFGALTSVLIALTLVCCAIALGLRVWGLDVARFARTATGGALSGVLRAGFIVILAVAAVEFVSVASGAFIQRLLRKRGARQAAKLRTISALLKGVANAVIVVIAAAMVLAAVGIEVAPLIAGAGVVGIAVGFGAQSLVKDLFTGAFLIVEDIVSYGDVVEIAGVTGTVEAMTLRTIRLRDFDGTLHVFPYGEAQVIHNKTSLFSYFAFEIQISYLSDIGRALDVIARAAQDIRTDKSVGDCLMGDVESLGVSAMADNGIVVRGRLRTQPGKQMAVGRVFYPLVKDALDAAGVLVSHRHTPVPPFDAIAERVEAASYKPSPQANGDAKGVR